MCVQIDRLMSMVGTGYFSSKIVALRGANRNRLRPAPNGPMMASASAAISTCLAMDSAPGSMTSNPHCASSATTSSSLSTRRQRLPRRVMYRRRPGLARACGSTPSRSRRKAMVPGDQKILRPHPHKGIIGAHNVRKRARRPLRRRISAGPGKPRRSRHSAWDGRIFSPTTRGTPVSRGAAADSARRARWL
ncbi:MAG: hypothetical protein A3I02_03175 [Betaproteobacteria bacterium RIFCSPLOWO2_02_FULL_67_26]|nr:MAG: hypothetical protein A3I02_03175 [Betaproteobacteria bacterium RIFCSPLOWO2_02_FULL_67_26]